MSINVSQDAYYPVERRARGRWVGRWFESPCVCCGAALASTRELPSARCAGCTLPPPPVMPRMRLMSARKLGTR